ncbi:unnamed protein product [Alopecurus aequalis]
MGKSSKKNKVILAPPLPPDVDDDDIVISGEDVDFVQKNKNRLHLITGLDSKAIDKVVTRVAGHDDDKVELLYEERERKRRAAEALNPRNDNDLEVDPVDALPVKTLAGEVVFRTAKKARSGDKSNGVESGYENKCADATQSSQKERKGRSNKKEDSKLQNLQSSTEVLKENLHSVVLEEVKEELSADELFEKKKAQLAELGMALLEDPESNIRSLNDLLIICNDMDQKVVKLGIMSLLAVFRDIIPSYRIRQLTDKELAVEVSKEVKKTRYYEYTLIRSYKAYLQKLISLEKQPYFYLVAVHCLCSLLDAAPHFNFRESLLASVVKNLSSSNDVARKLCCEAIRSLFRNEGKHRGEATIEAVRLIAAHVKLHDCQLHPDSIEVCLSLKFDEDLGKDKSKEEKLKPKKNKRYQNRDVTKPSEKKKIKKELLLKARQEVRADLRAVSFTLDPKEKKMIQRETLAALFETYFRILKHSMNTSRYKATSVFPGGSHPLLAPCLEGLGKFSHLIDLDFMSELIACLKKLTGTSLCNFITLYWSIDLTALITLKHLLQKNTKCRNMLENDAGGGSLSSLVAKYDPEAKDPYLSGALAIVLWELSLLQKHYDPSVSGMASYVLSMVNLNATQNPVQLSSANPVEAYKDLSVGRELSKPASKVLTLKCKRKRRSKEFVALSTDVLQKADCTVGEDELKEKLQSHFAVLRGISENERLRTELNHTLSSISMYKEYKKQKKQSKKSKTGRKKVARG